MSYREIKPKEKASSPASARGKFKVKNESQPAKTGKYTIKVGKRTTERKSIPHGRKDEYDCANEAVVITNVGVCDLKWLRS